MYAVILRKIKGFEVNEKKQITIQFTDKPEKVKTFLRAKKSMKMFEKWSEDYYESNKYVIERMEINLKGYFILKFGKTDMTQRSGKGIVEVLKNGIPYINLT